MAMNDRTDQELVEASLDGDRHAFSELVQRHQDAVFGLAVSLTRNREDAADMAQDAFIRAYRKLAYYNPRHPFRPWLLKICANLTKNLFRSRIRRRSAEEKHLREQAIDESVNSPDFEDLERALAQLPPKLGAPVRLKHIEGLSYDEIAKILGIGQSAAKMRVLRGRNQLLKQLQS